MRLVTGYRRARSACTSWWGWGVGYQADAACVQLLAVYQANVVCMQLLRGLGWYQANATCVQLLGELGRQQGINGKHSCY